MESETTIIQKITLYTLMGAKRHSSRKDIIAFVYNQPDILARYKKEKTVYNFVYKAKSRLMQMGMIKKRGRGFYALTKLGSETLSKPKDDIHAYFSDWLAAATKDAKDKKRAKQNPKVISDTSEASVPSVSLKLELATKLEKIKLPEFKRLIKQLMTTLAYQFDVTSQTKTAISGFIKQDQLGFRKVYVEAHCHNKRVKLSDMTAFLGTLTSVNAKEGLFITTGDFSNDAQTWAKNQGIVLLDRDSLVAQMITHTIGIKIKEHLEVKELDPSFFSD